LTQDDRQDGFALKFSGFLPCCKAAWLHLVASSGAIANVIGVGGRTGTAAFAIGGAVIACLLHLTQVLANWGAKD
jgi:3-oxoacyl-[acyl-carrier protein] reductase